MTVKQISVFVENEAGRLAEIADLFEKNGIDMRALSIAENKDFGILRMIVDDSYKAACILKEAECIFSITPVLAAEIPDEPGGLLRILNILGKNKINLEYTYAFITRNQEFAYMIFRVEDNERAIDVLIKENVRLISQEELSDL